MRRALVVVLAVLALPAGTAAATGFGAQADVVAGDRVSWPIEGTEGDSLRLEWMANSTVDVFVLAGTSEADALDGNGTPTPLFESLDTRDGRAHVLLSAPGPWLVVVDNTDGPAGGAPGASPVHVELVVLPAAAEPAPPADVVQTEERPAKRGEDPTLWNTLMFDAHHWDTGGPIELASVALWMIVLLAVACLGFSSPLRTVATLAGFAALFVMLWALVPRFGELTEIGPPALAGLALAWVAVKRTAHSRDSLQLAFVAAVVGAFTGVLLAYALQHLWSDPSTLYLGGRRFTDVLFVLPGFAVAGIVMFKVIPDIVHAIDDANADEAREVSKGPGQGETFAVTCLRCQTEVKVDRSMKRFRVATDRFEFACPNCQYWMEWQDPHAPGAAAA